MVQAILVATSPRYLRMVHRRYGDRFSVRMGRFGTLVYLADPEDIRAVFRGDPETYHAGEANASVLAPVLGPSSVLVTDEDVHQRQRRLMMPPFHGASVATLTGAMAEIAAADIESWPTGRSFAVVERMRAITLEIILRTVIGVRDPARLPALRRALPAVASLDSLTMLQFVLPRLQRRWPWRRFWPLVQRVDSLLEAEIERCRADPALDERPDVLAMLVRSRYPDGTAMTTASSAIRSSPCCWPGTRRRPPDWRGRWSGWCATRPSWPGPGAPPRNETTATWTRSSPRRCGPGRSCPT